MVIQVSFQKSIQEDKIQQDHNAHFICFYEVRGTIMGITWQQKFSKFNLIHKHPYIVKVSRGASVSYFLAFFISWL